MGTNAPPHHHGCWLLNCALITSWMVPLLFVCCWHQIQIEHIFFIKQFQGPCFFGKRPQMLYLECDGATLSVWGVAAPTAPITTGTTVAFLHIFSSSITSITTAFFLSTNMMCGWLVFTNISVWIWKSHRILAWSFSPP